MLASFESSKLGVELGAWFAFSLDMVSEGASPKHVVSIFQAIELVISDVSLDQQDSVLDSLTRAIDKYVLVLNEDKTDDSTTSGKKRSSTKLDKLLNVMAERQFAENGALASTALFRAMIDVKRFSGPFLIPYLEVVLFVTLGFMFMWLVVIFKASDSVGPSAWVISGVCATITALLTLRELVQMYTSRALELKGALKAETPQVY